MAGLYTEGESKILSGVYSLILAISTSITSGGRGIVAYPFTADWGPVNELTAGNLRELRDNYNAVGSSLSVGKIYTHASNGEPKKVLGYRMATAEATSLRIKRRLKAAAKQYVAGNLTYERYNSTLQSYMGMMKHNDCYRFKMQLLEDVETIINESGVAA